ncbi:hypothetical protein ACHAPT_011823 [Fusarium lateritium]
MGRLASTASRQNAGVLVAPMGVVVRGQSSQFSPMGPCHRLNKQCLPSDSVRTRHSQQNKDSGARIAQLEGKLDTVVSILQSLAGSTDSSEALRKLLDQQGVASKEQLPLPTVPATQNSSSSSASPSTDSDSILASTASSLPLALPSCSPHAVPTNVYTGPPQPSIDDAKSYLADFQANMLPNVPFIYLSPDATAEQLRLERPFFFRAIVAVSATSIQHKVERGRELKKILAHETLVDNRSSLDLLQGLLTYVAWGSDQFLTKTETMSRLVMMAMSMVYDLGLNRPPPPDEHMIGPFVPEFQCPIRMPTQETGLRLLELQRATLACFLLSSIIPRTNTWNQQQLLPNFERMECLWRSVNAIKSWLDIFLTLAPATWRGISFLYWGQLARCLVTLIRLSTLDDPSWDRQAVHNVVDLRVVLDRAADKIDQAGGYQPVDELIAQFPRSARILRAWLSAKMTPDESQEPIDWTSLGDENMGLDSVMPWITDAMDEWASF